LENKSNHQTILNFPKFHGNENGLQLSSKLCDVWKTGHVPPYLSGSTARDYRLGLCILSFTLHTFIFTLCNFYVNCLVICYIFCIRLVTGLVTNGLLFVTSLSCNQLNIHLGVNDILNNSNKYR